MTKHKDSLIDTESHFQNSPMQNIDKAKQNIVSASDVTPTERWLNRWLQPSVWRSGYARPIYRLQKERKIKIANECSHFLLYLIHHLLFCGNVFSYSERKKPGCKKKQVAHSPSVSEQNIQFTLQVISDLSWLFYECEP